MKKFPTPPELSGMRHIQGYTKFICDDLRPAHLLHLTILHSSEANAYFTINYLENPETFYGISKIITAKDIPGENQIGHLMRDEPLLPDKQVTYIGQPIALILSENQRDAELAISKIEVIYENLDTILTIDDAVNRNSFYLPEKIIELGNFYKAITDCPYILEDVIESGSQEHFYMETQNCRAYIGESNEVILASGTQSTSEVQSIVARVLGISSKDVTIDVKRLGGAFGGKERNATLFSCLTALSAFITKRPVELSLTRINDISCTGKRHPFRSTYKVGFNEEGKIIAYNVDLISNGGSAIDLSIPILERAMFHAENSYYIPNIKISGKSCRTNLPPNTAFRGFGAPQGIFVIENAIHKIARFLNKDPQEIRKINMYKENQITPYKQVVHDSPDDLYIQKCLSNSNYEELKKQVFNFNKIHKYKKRGLAVVPVKFGISFTVSMLNQGSALVWVYTDGSISVSHGGVEMGQSINHKVAIIVADTLGISIDRIKIESANTKRIGNASPTAASSGTDINGNAARNAAQIIKSRLQKQAGILLDVINFDDIIFKDNVVYAITNQEKKISFNELVKKAYENRVDLGAHSFYATPDVHFNHKNCSGEPFYYFVYGAALTEVEIDLLHGTFDICKISIVHETGKSICKDIDKGQITGAFVQGFGWCTMEEINFNERGQYLALTPSTYKFPGIRDIPAVWNIEMVEKQCERASVLGSKAIGEPPFIYGIAVWFAIKDAIESIKDYKVEAKLKHPATPEAVLLAIQELQKN